MNLGRVLRLLLVLAIVLAVLAGAVDLLWPQAVPAQARDAFRAVLSARPTAQSKPVIALGAAYWLLLITAVVGMFRQRRWGFHLALVVTVITMLQALLLGPHAYSGPAFMLSYSSKVMWGAALALAFVTSASGPAGDA